MIEALRKVIKRMHYPREVMLVCVRWYEAYPLSLRHIEEMMAERGVFVDHATVHRWSIKILPVLAAVFRPIFTVLPLLFAHPRLADASLRPFSACARLQSLPCSGLVDGESP